MPRLNQIPVVEGNEQRAQGRAVGYDDDRLALVPCNERPVCLKHPLLHDGYALAARYRIAVYALVPLDKCAGVLQLDLVSQHAGPLAHVYLAQARVELAATLAALGRSELANAETAAALEALRRLGAVPDSPSAGEVTPREREVLALLAEGLTNRQIAERLVLSEHTVHRHVANILSKLDVSSRAAAAAHAARAGL